MNPMQAPTMGSKADAQKREEEQRRLDAARSEDQKRQTEKADDAKRTDEDKRLDDKSRAESKRFDDAKEQEKDRLGKVDDESRREDQRQQDQQKQDQRQREQDQQQAQARPYAGKDGVVAAKPAEALANPAKRVLDAKTELASEVRQPGYRLDDTNASIAFFKEDEQKAFEERQAKATEAIKNERDPVKRTEMLRDKQIEHHTHYAQKKAQVAHEAEHGRAGNIAPRPNMKHPMSEVLRAESIAHQQQQASLVEAKRMSADASKGADTSVERNHAHERTVTRNEQHAAQNAAAGKSVAPEKTVNRAEALTQRLEAKQSERLEVKQEAQQAKSRDKSVELQP